MNKKVIALVGVGAMGLASLVPLGVLAAEAASTDQITTFAQELATKLGISQDKVQTALTELHSAKKAEMQATMNTQIDAAVTKGTITQRQADILKATIEARDELRPDKTQVKEDLSSLTQEEREAKFTEMKAQMDQKVLDALNAKGLNVTAEELTAARDAGKAAISRFGGPGAGGKGFEGHKGGRGMGMM